MKIELQDENAWAVYVHGEGLCGSFSLDCGWSEPITYEKLHADKGALDLTCSNIFLQRRKNECRICEAPDSCKCLHYEFNNVFEKDIVADITYEIRPPDMETHYTLDCSMDRIGFEGLTGSAGSDVIVKNIHIPDGCTSDIFLKLDSNQHVVNLDGTVEGRLEIYWADFGSPENVIKFGSNMISSSDLPALPAGQTEERVWVYTFPDANGAGNVISLCREACNDNTNYKIDDSCRDYNTASASASDDNIWLGADDTTLDVLAGMDEVNAGPGNDFITGGTDNDIIDGGLNDDSILGLEGDDTLISRDGFDFLVGGPGCDKYIIYPTHKHEHHFEEGCT